MARTTKKTEVSKPAAAQSSPMKVDMSSMPINGNLILILIIMQFFFSAYLFFKVNNLSANPARAADTNAAAAGAGAAPAADPVTDTTAMPEVTDADHIRGSKDAQVVMVEYSDFECPFCKTFHATLQQVMIDYGDKVSLIYRHYPLSFHPKAQKSAEAAECVAELGGNDAFWTFHDKVFEGMPDVELTGLAALAAESGVDQAAFQECLDSGKHATTVSAQMDGGSKAGVQGTPGLVLVGANGKRDFIGGAYPVADVKAKIDAILQ